MINKREPSASAALVLDLFDGLSAYKLLTSHDLTRLNLKREDLTDVEKRIPLTLIHELWQCALAKNPPSNIGLSIGKNVNPTAKGILAHLVSQSDNMKDALNLFRDKSALMSEGEKIQYSIEDEKVKIQYQYSNPLHYHKFAIERSLSIAITWCRHLTGHEFIPVECGFKHKKVEHLEQCKAMFGPNIRFEQAEDYLLFDANLLQLPIQNTNPYLKALLLKQAQEIEGQLNESKKLSDNVTEIIKRNLGKRIVNVQFIASQLNMSRQTLHRKLKQENSHFTKLLTDVRKQKSIELLKQNTLQIAVSYTHLTLPTIYSV